MKVAYHHYIDSSEVLSSEWGDKAGPSAEMWELSAGSGKQPVSGGQGGEPGATDRACKVRLMEKGKGWEVMEKENSTGG